MTRKIIIAVVAAVVAFAIVQIWGGTVAFKQGIDVETLRANATLYAAIVGIAVGAIVFFFSGNRAGIGSANQADRKMKE